MKNLVSFVIILTFTLAVSQAQTKQASQSASLIRGIKTVDLVNDLQIKIDFNPDTENLWITGSTRNNALFITEFIPLKDPIGTNIVIGHSYLLENPFASIEYKVLEIKDNRVVKIWYRVAVKMLKLPEESWI
ncbi:MAG TPA: hypothetical protein VMW76_07080 [Bacteroidales bacterium]|nr:hypothetical protein [Bacteroidales bacterium]